MLHLPSYNTGLAAGTVAKALGQELPPTIDEIPGISEVCDRAEGRFFFLLSFAEGYGDAFRYPGRQFSELHNDPKVGAEADGSQPEPAGRVQ
jgi:hypothetical protein